MGVLEGKAVVVTGAGAGIGAAYAEACAAEGADVVVNDVHEAHAQAVADGIRRQGGTAVAVAADISGWDEAGRLVAACVEAFGSIDGLVNNAGLFAVASPEESTEAEFRRLVEVNVLGSAFCGLHAMRHMLRQGSGSIVNVTSGSQAGMRDLAAYSMTKGAVSSLTYSWALDTTGTGVRVNAVSPNAHTAMAEAYERYRGTAGVGQNIGKRVEDNAPPVVYLLSDLAADVTGQVLLVDGTKLTVMTHPQPLSPPWIQERWTAQDVAAAVGRDAAAYLQPLGPVPRAVG